MYVCVFKHINETNSNWRNPSAASHPSYSTQSVPEGARAVLQQQRHHPRVARLGRQLQGRPGLAILLRLDLLVDVEPVQRQARVLPPLSLPLLPLLLLLALQPPPLEEERHQLHVVVGGG